MVHKENGNENYVDIKTYDDYHELLANKDIDASNDQHTDHWHAHRLWKLPLAGKHIYLQKPTSLTIEEGRMMSNTVQRSGVVFTWQPQRSINPWPQFKRACELVRNGVLETTFSAYWIAI
jgi:predicted dehydrogenase